MILVFVALVVSYLLGSIPVAYLAGKMVMGIDIRQHGSGNVGATNVFRVLGKKPGIVVFVCDVLKGVLPLTVIAALFGVDQPFARVLLGVASVCGHNWPVFLKFKGGKGVATSFGVIVGMAIAFKGMWIALLLCVAVWCGLFFLLGYVSFASIISAIVLPFAMLATSQPASLIFLGAVFCIFVVVRHKSNMRRLMSGIEPRVFWMGRRVL